MTQLARVLKALADPSRLRIVNVLSHRGVCVCDLQTVLGLSQPFISRHLAYLRKMGVVRDQREGPRVCYSLADDGPLAHAVQSLVRELLPLSQALQADLGRLAECGRSGRLRYYASWSEVEPGARSAEADSEPPASKAA
jgi:DNA-binding transcriptional ArsR family regulator